MSFDKIKKIQPIHCREHYFPPLNQSNHPGARGLYVWRGPVHIHINYLLMRALHHYQHSPGPYSEIAGNTYNELR